MSDSKFKVGDRIRVVQGTGPCPEGMEFVVTGVVRSPYGSPLRGQHFVTGDPADAGLWENFAELVVPPAKKQKIRVYVSKDDILKGKRNDPRGCPIQRALSRLFPEASISVGISVRQYPIETATVSIDFRTVEQRRDPSFTLTDEVYQRFQCPPKASQFVHDLDSGLGVEPFSFELVRRLPTS